MNSSPTSTAGTRPACTTARCGPRPVKPEEYGGAGGSFAHEAVINREFSLAGFDTFGAPLHSGIVAPYILHYGTAAQKKRWLPRLATGEPGQPALLLLFGAVMQDVGRHDAGMQRRADGV